MTVAKRLLVGMTGAMFGLLGTTGAARAVTIFSGARTDAASAFQAMQVAIGGVNNGAAGPQADGFRTINWDGVRLDGTDFGGNTEVIRLSSKIGSFSFQRIASSIEAHYTTKSIQLVETVSRVPILALQVSFQPLAQTTLLLTSAKMIMKSSRVSRCPELLLLLLRGVLEPFSSM